MNVNCIELVIKQLGGDEIGLWFSCYVLTTFMLVSVIWFFLLFLETFIPVFIKFIYKGIEVEVQWVGLFFCMQLKPGLIHSI